MKTCQVCFHTPEGDAATCPKCGEASWSESAAPPAVTSVRPKASEASDATDPATPSPSESMQRGGKRR